MLFNINAIIVFRSITQSFAIFVNIKLLIIFFVYYFFLMSCYNLHSVIEVKWLNIILIILNLSYLFISKMLFNINAIIVFTSITQSIAIFVNIKHFFITLVKCFYYFKIVLLWITYSYWGQTIEHYSVFF